MHDYIITSKQHIPKSSSMPNIMNNIKIPKLFWNQALDDKQQLFFTQVQIHTSKPFKNYRLKSDSNKFKNKSVDTVVNQIYKSLGNLENLQKSMKRRNQTSQMHLRQMNSMDNSPQKLSSNDIKQNVNHHLNWKQFLQLRVEQTERAKSDVNRIEQQEYKLKDSERVKKLQISQLNNLIRQREQKLFQIKKEINDLSQNKKFFDLDTDLTKVKQLEDKIEEEQNFLRFQQFFVLEKQHMLLSRENDYQAMLQPLRNASIKESLVNFILSQESQNLGQVNSQLAYLTSQLKKIDQDDNQIHRLQTLQSRSQSKSNRNYLVLEEKKQGMTNLALYVQKFRHDGLSEQLDQLKNEFNNNLQQISLLKNRKLEQQQVFQCICDKNKDIEKFLLNIELEIQKLNERLEEYKIKKFRDLEEINKLSEEWGTLKQIIHGQSEYKMQNLPNPAKQHDHLEQLKISEALLMGSVGHIKECLQKLGKSHWFKEEEE